MTSPFSRTFSVLEVDTVKKVSRGATAGASQEIDMPERRRLTSCLVPTHCAFVTENKLLCQRRARGFKREQFSYLNIVVTASNDTGPIIDFKTDN